MERDSPGDFLANSGNDSPKPKELKHENVLSAHIVLRTYHSISP